MNFDTKHLVRWGIPGWILIMILGPFLFFNFQKEIADIIKNSNALALGALITIIGVPLGYLLNQIHHSLFWVMRLFKVSSKIKKQDKWYEYFRKEIQVDNLFYNDEHGEKMQKRYSYLLSRKHELGGVMVSLFIVCFVMLLINLIKETVNWWSWIYLGISFILFLMIAMSRWYSSKNIDKYFEHYVKESNKLYGRK